MYKIGTYFIAISLCLIAACNQENNKQNAQTDTTQEPAAASPVAQLNYYEVGTYQHDSTAFTEGLMMIKNNILMESTGAPDNHQDSRILTYDLSKNTHQNTGITLKGSMFGEGSYLINGKIFWLTWKDGLCFVYDEASKKLIHTFKYQGEGWGMTSDGKSLIMSDGSSVIRYFNPEDFTVEKTLNVTFKGDALSQVNELELVDGYIYANVFEQDYIVKIDIQTGNVVGILDLSAIKNREFSHNQKIDVLNGIAYNAEKKTFLVTGKYWSKIYEIGIK